MVGGRYEDSLGLISAGCRWWEFGGWLLLLSLWTVRACYKTRPISRLGGLVERCCVEIRKGTAALMKDKGCTLITLSDQPSSRVSSIHIIP